VLGSLDYQGHPPRRESCQIVPSKAPAYKSPKQPIDDKDGECGWTGREHAEIRQPAPNFM
jgi:hypothetical protein